MGTVRRCLARVYGFTMLAKHRYSLLSRTEATVAYEQDFIGATDRRLAPRFTQTL